MVTRISSDPSPSNTNTYVEDAKDKLSSTFKKVQNSSCAQWTKETFEKIQRAVTPIFLGICAVGLFLSNSSLFVLGGIASVLFPDVTDSAIERIISIWRQMHWVFKTLVVLTAVTYALPISLALGALFAGAKVSLYLQNYDSTKPVPSEQTAPAGQ